MNGKRPSSELDSQTPVSSLNDNGIDGNPAHHNQKRRRTSPSTVGTAPASASLSDPGSGNSNQAQASGDVALAAPSSSPSSQSEEGRTLRPRPARQATMATTESESETSTSFRSDLKIKIRPNAASRARSTPTFSSSPEPEVVTPNAQQVNCHCSFMDETAEDRKLSMADYARLRHAQGKNAWILHYFVEPSEAEKNGDVAFGCSRARGSGPASGRRQAPGGPAPVGPAGSSGSAGPASSEAGSGNSPDSSRGNSDAHGGSREAVEEGEAGDAAADAANVDVDAAGIDDSFLAEAQLQAEQIAATRNATAGPGDVQLSSERIMDAYRLLLGATRQGEVAAAPAPASPNVAAPAPAAPPSPPVPATAPALAPAASASAPPAPAASATASSGPAFLTPTEAQRHADELAVAHNATVTSEDRRLHSDRSIALCSFLVEAVMRERVAA